MSKNLAVFISGSGSNLKTIADFCSQNPKMAKVSIVISNKKDILGIEIAKQFQIPFKVIESKGFKSLNLSSEMSEKYNNGDLNQIFENRQEYDKLLDNTLKDYGQIDLICLAGFMRVLSPWFCSKWNEKIINIHPSLLPSFKGYNAVEEALSFGVKITGCTVHFVSSKIDEGKIIAQEAVEILETDTKESLHSKIKSVEKTCYTKALSLLCFK